MVRSLAAVMPLTRACHSARSPLARACHANETTSSSKLEVKRTVSKLLTISEVSRRSGVASSALRFYEECGLIASERAGSGHRRYRRPVLRRIAFIVFAQRVGLTLDV